MRSIIKSKKGSYGDVFIFVIMAFLITLFFGLMYYGFGKINEVLTTVEFDIGTGEHATNFTNIVEDTWGEVYDAYSQLKILAYVLIFGMILTILISSWLVKSPPLFFIIYMFVSIAGIIIGVHLSNLYQDLLLNADFGATLQSFKGASYMILYLPYLAAIISLLSGLISLIGLNRSPREGRVIT